MSAEESSPLPAAGWSREQLGGFLCGAPNLPSLVLSAATKPSQTPKAAPEKTTHGAVWLGQGSGDS